jgi:hypothetical protein
MVSPYNPEDVGEPAGLGSATPAIAALFSGLPPLMFFYRRASRDLRPVGFAALTVLQEKLLVYAVERQGHRPSETVRDCSSQVRRVSRIVRGPSEARFQW